MTPLLQTILAIAGIVTIIVIILAYGFVLFKKAVFESDGAALKQAREEIAFFEKKADRLDKELALANQKLDLQDLQIKQLQVELENLRNLVMLDHVPPALINTFETILKENSDYVIDQVNNIIDRAEEKVAKPSSRRPKPSPKTDLS